MTEQKILRIADVEIRTGIKRSTIYLKIARREFPKQVSLGPRAKGWLAEEIDEWIDGRVLASRGSETARVAALAG